MLSSFCFEFKLRYTSTAIICTGMDDYLPKNRKIVSHSPKNFHFSHHAVFLCQAFHLKAATGLSSLCRDSPSSVVSLGGAHVLISLVKNKSADQIQTLVRLIANEI